MVCLATALDNTLNKGSRLPKFFYVNNLNLSVLIHDLPAILAVFEIKRCCIYQVYGVVKTSTGADKNVTVCLDIHLSSGHTGRITVTFLVWPQTAINNKQ